MSAVPDLLIIDGYTREARANIAEAGGALPSELYRAMVLRERPDAALEVLLVADLDAPLPEAKALARRTGALWTGSDLSLWEPSDPRVARQLALMELCFEVGLAQYGTCGGLQAAALVAGGAVGPNRNGFELGIARRIWLTDSGRKHAMMRGRTPAFEGFTTHFDVVTRFPRESTLLARNRFSLVQAAEIRHRGSAFWGLQYRPEYDLRNVARLLVTLEAQALERGMFRSSAELHAHVEHLETLAATPERADLAWRFSIDDDVLDPVRRTMELTNWFDACVEPRLARAVEGAGDVPLGTPALLASLEPQAVAPSVVTRDGKRQGSIAFSLITPTDPRWAGALARAAHDFWHLPEYVELNARHEIGQKTWALLVEDGTDWALMPFSLTRRADAGYEALTPTGHGGWVTGTPSSRLGELLRRTTLPATEYLQRLDISPATIRLHPILQSDLSAWEGVPGALVWQCDTVVIDLLRPAEVAWSETRARFRTQINAARRAGCRITIDEDWKHVEGFHRMYLDTMERVGAAAMFNYSMDYLRDMKALLGERYLLVLGWVGDEIACGACFVDWGEIVTYHLAAADPQHFGADVPKLLIAEMRDHFSSGGRQWLQLESGDDALLQFKRGFSKVLRRLHTWTLPII